ncbi:MAG: ArnT family glycosyltransferase [Candidatus Limnocylindria bacterium]
MKREAALLAAFAAFLFVRLGAVGLIDYDEAAYAQAAHEMLERGDWLAPTLNGEPFFEKPPLLYWGQILGYRALGVGEAGARVGSALAALAALAALYVFSKRPLGARVAGLGALALGSSLAFASLARVALTDLWLLLCIVLALGCFHRALEASARAGGSRWFVAFCACCGLAMLAKGAVGALLPLAAAAAQLALLRRLSLLLRPGWWLAGGAALLAIGLSWYLLLGLTQPDGFAFMSELFLEHHLDRFTSPKEGHRGSIFYYLPVLVLAFAPWSALLPVALARRFGAASERERWLRLLGLLAAVTLVFFSAAATKLPHYLLPALPGLALLVADRLAGKGPPIDRRALAWSVAGTVLLLLALAGGLAAAEAIAARLPDWLGEQARKAPGLAFPLDLGPAPAAAALAALATAAVVIACRRSPSRLGFRLGAGSLLVWALIAWGATPRWDSHFQRPLRTLALAAAAQPDAGQRLLLVGLRRKPSVVFYGGRRTDTTSGRRPERVAARLAGPRTRLAIASQPDVEKLARSLPLETIARDTGYVLFRAAAPRDGGAALP